VHGNVPGIKTKLYRGFVSAIGVFVCTHGVGKVSSPNTKPTVTVHQSIDMILCTISEYTIDIAAIESKALVEESRVREIITVNEYKTVSITNSSSRFVRGVRAFDTIDSFSPWYHVFNLNPMFFFLWFIIAQIYGV
jgi:hypothetical protein